MKKIILFISIVCLLNAVFLFQIFFAHHLTLTTQQQILSQNDAPIYSYKIIKTYPHKISYFTEGLALDHDMLYESSGLYGQSHLTKTNFNTQEIIQNLTLNNKYFGEGITIFHNKLYQLTYQSHIGFVYNPHTLQPLKTFHISSQGWGLTHDKHSLIMSNGSAVLTYFNPKTFKKIKSLTVHMGDYNIGYLNDLEYIHGMIYANVWQTNLIAIINALTGEVKAWINLTGLNPNPVILKGDFVLNGIAYNPKTNHFIVTGKCWPKLYEIETV